MGSRALVAAALAALFLASTAAPARAQDSSRELVDSVLERVVEIHRLLREAEEHLADSTLDRTVTPKAERETEGAGAAESPTPDGEETPRTREERTRPDVRRAQAESARASEALRDLLTHSRRDAKEVSEHIQWLLDNAFQ